MEEEKLNDQELARRAKLPRYEELGVDAFGSRYEWKDSIKDLRAKYGSLTEEELAAKQIPVNVAGRLMSIRRMGKASFVNIKDEYGNMQAWLGRDVVGEHDYEVFKLADIGDIVGLEGTLMLTRTGELTIRTTKYTHITKCLKPLPEKFHGLTDIEERCRRRYVDLIINDESRKNALTRSAIVKGIRNYSDSLGFVEVETPACGSDEAERKLRQRRMNCHLCISGANFKNFTVRIEQIGALALFAAGVFFAAVSGVFPRPSAPTRHGHMFLQRHIEPPWKLALHSGVTHPRHLLKSALRRSQVQRKEVTLQARQHAGAQAGGAAVLCVAADHDVPNGKHRIRQHPRHSNSQQRQQYPGVSQCGGGIHQPHVGRQCHFCAHACAPPCMSCG